MTIEMHADALALMPDALRVRDPEYIRARLHDILEAAQHAGASAPGGFQMSWEISSLRQGCAALAADIRLFGPEGEASLVELQEKTPALLWARASRFISHAHSVAAAEQAAATLGLAEQARAFDNRRVWGGERGGFEVRVYGPQEDR